MSSNLNIIATPYFAKQAKVLRKRYKSFEQDYFELLKLLKDTPFHGINLGNGFRKIRLAIKSKNKGKSGSARVITLTTKMLAHDNSGTLYLIDIYDKEEQESISIKELLNLVKNAGLDK
jgi:hypothetical protein